MLTVCALDAEAVPRSEFFTCSFDPEPGANGLSLGHDWSSWTAVDAFAFLGGVLGRGGGDASGRDGSRVAGRPGGGGAKTERG